MLNIAINPNDAKLLATVNRIEPRSRAPVETLPEDVRASLVAAKPNIKRFHGSKFSLAYFPFLMFASPCADKFGYMSSPATRTASKLPVNATTKDLMRQLGTMMGDL